MPDEQSGTAVDLDHAAKYKGRRIGSGKNQGECATGVQVVFIDAGKPLGFTRTWKQGKKVRGNKIKPGTAIATFRNGRYSNDHAAILIEERSDGLWVWDQFNTPRKSWGKRLLPFNAGKNDRSNNGDLFYTITK
jgi:hypothetical protein